MFIGVETPRTGKQKRRRLGREMLPPDSGVADPITIVVDGKLTNVNSSCVPSRP